MFYWSKELLIGRCVFLHLINSWHILHCQTTKVHIMQMWSIFFVRFIRRAHSTLLLNIEAAPFLHSCLSGVFLVFLCFGILLLPSAGGSQKRSMFSSKRRCFIKAKPEQYSRIFHWLTALWVFSWTFSVRFEEVNQMWHRQRSTLFRPVYTHTLIGDLFQWNHGNAIQPIDRHRLTVWFQHVAHL